MSARVLRSPLLLATAGIWLLCWVVWTVDNVVENAPHQLDDGVRGFLCDVAGALLCGAIYRLLQRLERRSLALRLGAMVALAIVATLVFMVILYAAYHVVLPVGPASPNWLRAHIDVGVAILWTILACCGIYFTLGLGTALRNTQAVALDTQNRMLRYQLDPHFLFNIHSALATLIHDGRNAEAEKVVDQLSNFLRRTLEKDPCVLAPLEEELSAMREYMGVEAARFGDRLRFVEAIDPAVQGALAPSFILQPLLENAIKHGLGQSAQPITIELGAVREADGLKLWVQDDGTGKLARGTVNLGVGLENVRSRLEGLYGARADVVTEKRTPCGFKVTLTLPLAYA
jgi:signal transduction histidine kinase